MKINVLHEDNHIIVCEKPPGIPAQSDKTSDNDMINQLKNYIYSKEPDKGQPYIGIVHRLDRPVGGLMVFAKTAFAAKGLSEQIRLRAVKKKYLGVITGDLSNKIGQDKILLTDFLVKNGRTNLAAISTEKDRNSQKAELYYKVLETAEITGEKKLSLLEIELLTGRHHQIRVQLQGMGCALWGDTKYNKEFEDEESRRRWIVESEGGNWTNIALFAYELEFHHPKTNKEMLFRLQPSNLPFSIFRTIKDHSLF